MRHAGVGFPNGPVDNARVFALPSPELLMLVTEARYHHAAAVQAGKRVVWRAIPRIGKRPAELGWSPPRFVTEALNLTDTATEPITDFIWANELDLNTERGDLNDDWSGLHDRYALIGGWAFSVVQSLRQWSPGTRIHWPAWTPDHYALDHLDSWRAAAEACQVIDFHGYDSLDKIRGEYLAYRRAFPGKPLALTEWHGKGDVAEERRILEWLAETMAADPLFDAAYFFIWRWHQPASWWDSSYDIESNPARLALFRDPPVIAAPAPEPEPEPVTMTPIEAFIRDAAQKRGIDPDIAVRVANSEGSVTEPARRGTFDTGSSWWPFQLHYGGAGYEYLGTVAGMGNGFTALTGWQPGDPAACNDSIRYALNRANLGGWGPWYGAAHVGIGRWDGIDRNAAWDASSEPWDYETPAVAPAPDVLAYNPDAQVDRQPDDWSCSVQSVQWLLRALGRNPSDAWMEQSLVPAVVSKSVGLLNATGQGMAEWIEREYGYPAVWRSGVSFDDVLALAGKQPVMVGGRAYGPGGHWVGVRRADENGWLELANSAPNYTNTGTHLDRNEWAARGPWSLITVPVAVQEAEEVTVAEAEQLRAENQRLRDVIGYASHDVAAAAQKEADTLRSSLDALQAAIDTLKRQAA